MQNRLNMHDHLFQLIYHEDLDISNKAAVELLKQKDIKQAAIEINQWKEFKKFRPVLTRISKGDIIKAANWMGTVYWSRELNERKKINPIKDMLRGQWPSISSLINLAFSILAPV